MKKAFTLLSLALLGSAHAATLTLWTSFEAAGELAWIKAQAAAFEKATGNKVTLVSVPFAQTQDKFIQSAPKGQGPDLIATEPHDRLGRYAASGVIEPMDKYITSKADYDKTALSAFTYQGKLFGLPLNAEAVALVYNKKLVPSAPTTWDAFLKAAQANTGNGKFGYLADIAEPYKSYGFVSAYGGYVFKNNGGTLDTKDIGLDNAGTAKALGFLNDLRYKYNLVAEGVSQDAAKSAFVDGKLAMFYTGPWDMGDIKKAGIDYGIVPFPTPPGATGKWSPFVGVRGILVSAYSKNKTVAVQLARQLTSSASQLSFNAANGSIPTSLSARSKLRTDPVVAGFGKAVAMGTPMPNIPEMGSVWGPWAAATAQGVQKANQPYSDLLKKAVTEISSNINK
ncbi:maltose ABC transporter substrate-binding protein [Deinococcus sp. KSM4-11]|uniref:sugar ABC transporter substrate-binding protein n=1 Tax=Deinococcus sp. KSM4-11 TaxID=2568654 RepID=UPI0010A44CF9|nr:maltose ABC transporter substrate-binding protein [Deinococcus sp. KSM4-11]THF86668.1 maltose ABC transporter substrate-binding protein [Deinococcus sp. KSM4-11]